jgi:hypothetical protein
VDIRRVVPHAGNDVRGAGLGFHARQLHPPAWLRFCPRNLQQPVSLREQRRALNGRRRRCRLCLLAIALSRQAPALRGSDARADLPLDRPRNASLHSVRAGRSAQQLPRHDLCHVSVSIPFSIYLLVGYLEAVPRSLDEAAILDGCSQFQVIWRIVFPIMLPGVVATATYAFLLCWSEYLFALAFLTQTELKTMPLLLSAFFGENVVEWGNVMAGSALMTLPTLLLFLPLQTRMASGLAAGAVKQ